MKLVNLTVSFQNPKEHNKDQADSTEFELPLILKSGLFPKAADLAIFKNHNETISKTPSDCSNSTIKEGEEKAWVSLETAN